MLRRVLLLAAVLTAAISAPALGQANAPTVFTGAADHIGQNTATVHGAVNPQGQSTEYWIEYGRTALNERSDMHAIGNGTDPVDIEVQLRPLRAGTTFRYRVVARNASGTTEGALKSFRTAAAPAAPTATTTAASDLTQAGATLNATVNNRGTASSVIFEYGPSRTYGTTTAPIAVGASTSNQNINQAISGLAADTVYHFRVVQTIGSDTVRGADRSFRTTRIPNGLLLQSSANPVGYGAGVDMFGVLAGSANAGKLIRVQADTYPFDGSWTTVASGRTDSTGAYRIHVEPLLTNSQFRTMADTSPAVTSQSITVGVRLRTSLRVGSHRVRRGHRVRFSGQITPEQAGSAISIQNRRGSRWVTIGHTRAGDNSRFSTRVRIRRSGKYRVVARPTDGGHVMGNSSSRYIRVRR